MGVENLIYPLAGLLGVSVLTEAVVEIIKSVVPKQMTENAKRIMALIVSIIIALVLNVSILTGGWTFYVGVILAGMISSRGSNYIHSLSAILEVYAKVKK